MRLVELCLAGERFTFAVGDGTVSLVHGTTLVEVRSLILSCGRVLTEQQLMETIARKEQRN